MPIEQLKSRKFGPYEIQENIFGDWKTVSIFKARNLDWNTPCCVRIVNKSDKNQMDQFKIELEISKELKWVLHQNLVRIYDIIEEDDYNYIFQELCDSDLDKHSTQLNKEEILDLIIQVASGYIKLMERNIIHRDIKQENILIKKDNKGNIIYKIADFGQSKKCNDVSQREQTFSQQGTTAKKAPEIYNSDYSFRADIFSFGLVLLELYLNFKINNEKDLKTLYSFLEKNSFIAIQDISDESKQLYKKIQNIFKYNKDDKIIQLIDQQLKYKKNDRIDWQKLLEQAQDQKNQKSLKGNPLNEQLLEKIGYHQLIQDKQNQQVNDIHQINNQQQEQKQITNQQKNNMNTQIQQKPNNQQQPKNQQQQQQQQQQLQYQQQQQQQQQHQQLQYQQQQQQQNQNQYKYCIAQFKQQPHNQQQQYQQYQQQQQQQQQYQQYQQQQYQQQQYQQQQQQQNQHQQRQCITQTKQQPNNQQQQQQQNDQKMPNQVKGLSVPPSKSQQTPFIKSPQTGQDFNPQSNRPNQQQQSNQQACYFPQNLHHQAGAQNKINQSPQIQSAKNIHLQLPQSPNNNNKQPIFFQGPKNHNFEIYNLPNQIQCFQQQQAFLIANKPK